MAPSQALSHLLGEGPRDQGQMRLGLGSAAAARSELAGSAAAPLAVGWGAVCSWEHLETSCLETLRCCHAWFSSRPAREARCPGCGMWAPSQAPRPPRTVVSSEGTDSGLSKFLPAPEALSRPAPGTQGVRSPRAGWSQRAAGSEGSGPPLSSAPGAGMFSDGGSRLPRPVSAAAAFLVGAQASPASFFQAPVPAQRARGGEGRFPGQPRFLLFLIFFFMVSPTLKLSRQFADGFPSLLHRPAPTTPRAPPHKINWTSVSSEANYV